MNAIASIRFSDISALALNSIKHHRLRSSLTIGAVAVGIGVMVYLVSMGFGLERLTLGEVAKSNTLLSITVRSPIEKLPLDDKAVDKIEQIGGVKEVLPKMSVRGQLSLENQKAATTIVGVDPEYLALTESAKQTVGNVFRAQDLQTMVVTTGLLKLFALDPSKVPLVPFNMDIDQEDFPGVAPTSNLYVRGVIESDAAVAYLPRLYLENQVLKVQEMTTRPNYEDIKLKVSSLNDIEPVQKSLIAYGFRVETVAETMSEIKKVFSWIRLILGALGLVAMIVASIGMFNTMTISLLERTKEIGIMKALGVKKSDISRIFLTEAFLMGLIGGLAGLALAFIGQQITLFILNMLATMASDAKVPVVFLNHWYILLGSLIFAMLVALITGFYPAKRATHLHPIEAIRYE